MDQIEVKALALRLSASGRRASACALARGFGISSSMWRRQLDGLSDEFTVVAWDAPGCGRSSDPPEGFGASDYAEPLAAFMEAPERFNAEVRRFLREVESRAWGQHIQT